MRRKLPVRLGQIGPVLKILVLELMCGGNFAEVVLEVFMVVFAPPFYVGVLLSGVIEHAHFLDVSVDFAVGEISSEVGVFEWVVVGQGHLADVVAIYEGFFRLVDRGVPSSHSIKLIIPSLKFATLKLTTLNPVVLDSNKKISSRMDLSLSERG